MTVYIDASVLLRIVLDQPEPPLGLGEFAQRITSVVTEVECLRTVDAARLTGALDQDEYADRRVAVRSQLRRMQRVAVSGSVLRRAGEPLPAPLKTLDALHIATALQWREHRAPGLVFATHDRQQGRVATLLGFDVIGL